MISATEATQAASESIRTNAAVVFGSIQHVAPYWIVRFILTYKSGRTEYITVKVNDETGVVQK